MAKDFVYESEKTWMRAVRADRKLLAKVPECFCTLKFQKLILNADWRSIRYIKNPCPEIQYHAIEKNPLAIKYIDVQDEGVVRAVLKQDWKYLKFVKDENLLKQFINDDADLIKFVKKPSEELQVCAVHKQPEDIKYISNPTTRVQLYVVGKNPKLIQYIKKPEASVQMVAFRQDKSCANLIDNPCPEIESYALHEKIIQENTMSKEKFDDYFKQLQNSMLKQKKSL